MAVTSAGDSDPNYLQRQMLQQKQRNYSYANALAQLKKENDDYDGPTVSLKRPTAESINEAENAPAADPKDKYKRAIARAKYA